jgi:hypothetical protein
LVWLFRRIYTSHNSEAMPICGGAAMQEPTYRLGSFYAGTAEPLLVLSPSGRGGAEGAGAGRRR